METLTHKLYSTLRQFCKDNQIKMNDPKFITAYKNIFLELHPSDYQPSLPNLKDLPKPIVELYEAFVQQSIDMIRNNPDIKEKLIEDIDKQQKSLILPDTFIPDVRIYFGADNLLDSVDAGEHIPSTDASLTLTVGNKPIYSIM